MIGTEYNKVNMPIMNWQTIANKSRSILKFMGFLIMWRIEYIIIIINVIDASNLWWN